jgi:hypothetical protein
VRGELVRDGDRMIHVVACSGDLGDDAPLLGLSGVESPAPQHQIAGAARTDRPGNPGDPAGGRQDSDVDLRKPENRCGICNPNVSGEREFQTAAEEWPVIAATVGWGSAANSSYTEPEPR